MTRRVLLIKLTSLGDLIHALPALSDAARAYPGITFDWLVDENFQEIASWHPNVRKIFTTNHRNWRHALRATQTYHSIYNLIRSLRKETYDVIIDGQGNFKTALLTFCMRGLKAGYDRASVREKVASFAYQKKCAVPKQAHAIARLRQLFASALDYPLPNTPPDFGIDRTKFQKPQIELPSEYLVFVTNASWETKLWPEEHWLYLIKRAASLGHTILLPWGTLEEEARAKKLACSSQVIVLPRLSLSEGGYVLAGAKASVCVDTGLSHLSAALNIPSITLYGSTDAGLIGASGHHQTHIQSTLSCAPCYKKKCPLLSSGLQPPCLASLHPERIFSALKEILA